MKKRIASVIFQLTMSVLLIACFGLFDSSSETITGRYKVMWIDLQVQQFICREFEENSNGCVTVVPEYVFAVGHNESFIIAKQHPTSGFENGFKLDTSVTNYYIIDISEESKTKEHQLFGPLSKEEFDQKRKEFGIEQISFEITYPENPGWN